MTPQSEAERIAFLSVEAQDDWLTGMDDDAVDAFSYTWQNWCRPNQRPPAGEWRVWLLMAGRGFGKTRAGAEWVRAQAEADGRLRIALIGATLAEARAIMVEGESGLLNIPQATPPLFEPSLRRLTWPSGATATLYAATEPESLRGPQHHIAWADEIGKWDHAEAIWSNLNLTLRLGNNPQIAATTTPRPVPLIRRLLKEHGVSLTKGRTQDNRAHLPTRWLAAMEGLYGATRLGRQELAGELIEDVEGALWSRAMIEACRCADVPEMVRVVIGVDPPASEKGDACGIVAVGLGHDGRAWVLGDHSVSGLSPEGWARAVSAAAQAHGADRVIAEGNMGGNMVEATLRAVDANMPVRRVHASRGKVARAEPVAALYEAGKARHVAAFSALEDELCGLVTGGYQGPGRSPDRADALVWAVTDVMLGVKERVVRVRVV